MKGKIYFWLLFLNAIATVGALVYLSFELGALGLVLMGLTIVWLAWKILRLFSSVIRLQQEGIEVTEYRFPELYHDIASLSERLNLKTPRIYIVGDDVSPTRGVSLFRTNVFFLPEKAMRERNEFERARELLRLKHNDEEKRFALLLGSWIPFLRPAYLRTISLYRDRQAMHLVDDPDSVMQSILKENGRHQLINEIDVTAYLAEKRQITLAEVVSEMVYTTPTTDRRLIELGWMSRETPTGQHAVRFLLVASSIVAFVLIGWSVQNVSFSNETAKAVVTSSDESKANGLQETKLMAAIQKGTLEEVQKELPDGDMKAVDADGDTALHYLGYRKSSEGLKEIFDTLLKQGSDVDAINDFGERPFITAVYSNNNELVELYLKNGENINQLDDQKYTPLHHAVEGEGVQTVKVLLEQGADVSIKNKDGLTPLMLAQQYELDDIIRLLKQHTSQTL
ncbi:ankyrin repeat domain-containing protein [Exiguobacterium indicum]|uniref:ankyrin repeat domain-containing protein n=1 Tax=Exiguobacterium indicum TaxID=296995 RepID=UPI00094F698C|nr:ankyrin repeat domain-containing protein [Exiguobacterium indicum]